MTNFIGDNTDLPYPKVDLKPVPIGVEVAKYARAIDWNNVCQALVDVKGFLRAGVWHGFTAQASDPAPAGLTTYLYVDTLGSLHLVHNGTDIRIGSNGVISVKDFGALGNYNPQTGTGQDDRSFIIAAVTAALVTGSALRFPPGNYRLSKYVNIAGANKLQVLGSAFSFIYYASDDLTVVNDATALSVNEARSAFLVTYSNNVSFEGISFVGGDHPLAQRNVGCGVYARHVVGLTVAKCTQRNGHSILAQDATKNSAGTGDSMAVAAGVVTLTDAAAPFSPGHRGRYITIPKADNLSNCGTFEILSATPTTVTYLNPAAVAETSSFLWTIDDDDRNTVVEKCRIEHARGILTPGSHTRIVNCEFEQPMTRDLTGIGDLLSKDGTTMTLHDANATWDTSVVGRYVKIAGSTSGANNVTAQITAATAATRYTPGTLTFENAAGVPEPMVPSTSSWWIAGGDKVGRGAGATALAKTGSTMTLTASAPAFSPSVVGMALHVTGVVTPANYGVFIVTAYISPTQISYENSLGVAETFNGIWALDSRDAWPDVGGTYGSDHAIYVFGGRVNILVDGCTFTGIRKTCVKVSGSSGPIDSVEIRGCFARECGTFAVVGADDTQRHSGINIHHNYIIDCGTGRRGWQDQCAIEVYGSRGTRIERNTFSYTRKCLEYVRDLGSVAERFVISVKRYVYGFSQPLEDLTIEGNVISGDPRTSKFDHIVETAISVRDAGSVSFHGVGGTFTKSGSTMTLSAPGILGIGRDQVGMQISLHNCPDAANNIVATVLSVPSAGTCTFTNASGVGLGAACGAFRITPKRPHPTVNWNTSNHCRVLANTVNAVGSTAFRLERCASPTIRGNAWSGVSVGINIVGCSMPVINDNQEMAQENNNPNIVLGPGTSWPVVFDNYSSNASVSGSESIKAALRIADAAGAVVDYPLLGKSGRARPSDAKEELVVAYGAGFADGDTIYVWNGATFGIFVYKASAPTGSQFNTFAGLVALIDAMANITCVDYGAGFSDGSVSTQHMLIRGSAAGTGTGTYFTIIDTANPTSLVLLRNQVASGSARCDSRGGGSAGPTADKTVVWSQLCRLAGGAILYPDNASGRTLLGNSFLTLKDANNDGCCAVVQHDTSVGTEEFRWLLA